MGKLLPTGSVMRIAGAWYAYHKAKTGSKKEREAATRFYLAILEFQRLLKETRLSGLASDTEIKPEDYLWAERLWEWVLEAISKRVEHHVTEFLNRGNVDYGSKRQLVSRINNDCRNHNMAIRHPDSGDPCILLAIRDNQKGTFVLESRETKRRSKTTKDISSMLPLTLVWIDE